MCSAGISEVSGLRVEVIVWGMPAAASSAASSFEAAAAAAVAADISAFLTSIYFTVSVLHGLQPFFFRRSRGK